MYSLVSTIIVSAPDPPTRRTSLCFEMRINMGSLRCVVRLKKSVSEVQARCVPFFRFRFYLGARFNRTTSPLASLFTHPTNGKSCVYRSRHSLSLLLLFLATTSSAPPTIHFYSLRNLTCGLKYKTKKEEHV